MNRREFMALGAAISVALPLSSAQAATVEYAPGVAETAMANGERIVLRFYTDWCSTCARQERVINSLRAEMPQIDSDMTVIEVNWDEYANSDLARQFNVPRRSTIIALKGSEELGRSVAGTSTNDIRALFQAALDA